VLLIDIKNIILHRVLIHVYAHTLWKNAPFLTSDFTNFYSKNTRSHLITDFEVLSERHWRSY